MKKQELLKLNLSEGRELGNGHRLFTHELFTLMFIEKDGDYEVWKEDKNRLDIIRQFEENERLSRKK